MTPVHFACYVLVFLALNNPFLQPETFRLYVGLFVHLETSRKRIHMNIPTVRVVCACLQVLGALTLLIIHDCELSPDTDSASPRARQLFHS